MCQLFGLNSAQPAAPHFPLRGFFRRGGITDDHADGWGVAWYDNQQSYLQVRTTPAGNCMGTRTLLGTPFRSTNVIAHVRKATIGTVATRNSHPFVRRLWGRDWVFAHNGDLKQFQPPRQPGFAPVGETDSEQAFCYLLGSLQARFGDVAPADAELMAHIHAISLEIASFGTFNFLLSDGRLLFAHCSTLLHWTERRASAGTLELVDDSYSIDLRDHHGPDDRSVVIATKPLTRGEAWQAMTAGELRLFIGGESAAVLRTTAPAQLSLAG